MAKKKRTTSGTTNFVRGCAYVALLVAAFTFLFSGLIYSLDISLLTRFVSVFNLIGQICLAIGIALPAYDFTRGKGKFWRVLFWIALIVYLLGCVFGVIRF